MNPALPKTKDLLAVPKIVQEHRENLAIMREFIVACGRICMIQELSIDDVQMLCQKMLNYSDPFDFDTFFRTFLTYTRDAGQCLFNTIWTFSIASHNMRQLLHKIEQLCRKCEDWKFEDVIRAELIYHPAQRIRIAQKKSKLQQGVEHFLFFPVECIANVCRCS